MKKHLTLMGLVVVFALSLIIFSGCAEKQAVVKDEAVQNQKAAPAATTADDEAARKAKEAADAEEARKKQAAREAFLKKSAAIENELNLQIIFFDYNKSSIRPDAREMLKANAEIFTKNKDAKIVIEGYCDERGTAEYNMALGERRAQEAKQYLVNLGINASRMETISYGEEKPLDPGNNEAAWAQNRRAQFLLK